MAANSFLVLGTYPASNEVNIPTNIDITISFSTDMSQTSLDEHISIKKVNGETLDKQVDYSYREVTISGLLLEENTQYDVIISGGIEGIKSLTGDYLPESKVIRFTTEAMAAITPPTQFKAEPKDNYVTLSWELPNQYNLAKDIEYQVKIGETTVESDPAIWPLSEDFYRTQAKIIEAPKRLSDGTYYAYLRAYQEDVYTEWVAAPFIIDTTEVIDEEEDIFSDDFRFIDAIPNGDIFDTEKNESIAIQFNKNVDPLSEPFYLVEAKKETITPLKLATIFSKHIAVPGSYDTLVDNTIITFTPQDGLKKDTYYTIIIPKETEDVDGQKLKVTQAVGFRTEKERLYGDVQYIIDELENFGEVKNKDYIYDYIESISDYAYDIVSKRSDFLEADYEDGRAPYYVHKYVQMRSLYDLILNVYIRSSTGQTTDAKLGDLSISKETMSTSGPDILLSLKERIKPWEDLLIGEKQRAKPQQVTRQEVGSPYPDFFTRTEFEGLGD